MAAVVKIPDMTCEHYKATVEQALLGVEGVRRVEDAGYSVSELAR